MSDMVHSWFFNPNIAIRELEPSQVDALRLGSYHLLFGDLSLKTI